MSSSAPPPSGLRERVVAAARAVRPAGRAVPEPPPITAVEAFSRVADALNNAAVAHADGARGYSKGRRRAR